MPAIFGGAVDAVGNDEALGVFEYEGCHLERNAVVFLLILEVLSCIPLVLHGVYTECSLGTASKPSKDGAFSFEIFPGVRNVDAVILKKLINCHAGET